MWSALRIRKKKGEGKGILVLGGYGGICRHDGEVSSLV